MDERFYLGLANELAAKLGRVSSFVSHGPSVGTYHEEVLRSILRHMLPDRFTLRTGFVFHPDRGASQQGDILIVDEYYPGAYFFREGDFAVVAEEALVCVIEVKTNLNGREFRKSLQGLYSFQRATANPHHPLTLLFAYKSSSFTPAVLESWYKSVELPDQLLSYPFAIYALNRGLLYLCHPSDAEWGHCVILGAESRGPKLKALSVFLSIIRKALLSHGQVDSNPFAQARLDGLSWSHQFLKFGSGIYDRPAT